MKQKTDELQVISVKVPQELRLWLKSQAVEGYRSMSGQVLLLLESARAAHEKQVSGA